MAEKRYYGMYQGIVSSNKDPEKRGRIKVTCPDVLGGTVESAWCDPCITVAYDNGGDFCIPQIDEAVWLLFINGDSNKPVYLGGWWQKDKTPLGSNYSGIDDLRIINYADTTITMKKGVININVGAGVCDLKIEHNKVTILGDLVVEGSISSNSLSTGSISASGISASSISANSVTASSYITS